MPHKQRKILTIRLAVLFALILAILPFSVMAGWQPIPFLMMISPSITVLVIIVWLKTLHS